MRFQVSVDIASLGTSMFRSWFPGTFQSGMPSCDMTRLYGVYRSSRSAIKSPKVRPKAASVPICSLITSLAMWFMSPRLLGCGSPKITTLNSFGSLCLYSGKSTEDGKRPVGVIPGYFKPGGDPVGLWT